MAALLPQAIFTLLLGPFAFFNAQKTKYLQILTSLMRWIGKSKLVSPLVFDGRLSLHKQDFHLPFIHLPLPSPIPSSPFFFYPYAPPPFLVPPPRVAAGSAPSIMLWSCPVPLIPVSFHPSA